MTDSACELCYVYSDDVECDKADAAAQRQSSFGLSRLEQSHQTKVVFEVEDNGREKNMNFASEWEVSVYNSGN
jgi:hypothetical protein